MSSIRQRLMDAIELRCKTMLKANDYATNLGANVFVWRPQIDPTTFQEHELPALNLCDVTNDSDSQSPNNHHHTLKIQADVIHMKGHLTAVEVRKMIADLHKCIGADRYWHEDGTGEKLAHRTDLENDAMTVEELGRTIGGARVTFTVQFRTAPYAPDTLR